ncbi:hypothetical protein [Enterococcus sp. AZ172]|uniref:hypothetical protein n=1 Tax=unclassified Enterococcus TaxID=2608891 RepID=UPI003E16741B
MYEQPILFLGIGGCLLIGNIFLLLSDYKNNLIVNESKRNLYINALVLILVIATVVLGIIHLFMINQQL